MATLQWVCPWQPGITGKGFSDTSHHSPERGMPSSGWTDFMPDEVYWKISISLLSIKGHRVVISLGHVGYTPTFRRFGHWQDTICLASPLFNTTSNSHTLFCIFFSFYILVQQIFFQTLILIRLHICWFSYWFNIGLFLNDLCVQDLLEHMSLKGWQRKYDFCTYSKICFLKSIEDIGLPSLCIDLINIDYIDLLGQKTVA